MPIITDLIDANMQVWELLHTIDEWNDAEPLGEAGNSPRQLRVLKRVILCLDTARDVTREG